MVKIFKHNGKPYEGNFTNIPGKLNYGHLIVGGKMLYNKLENGEQGKATIFTVASESEVKIADDSFSPDRGFFNLKATSGNVKAKLAAKPTAPKKPEVELSSKAAEIVDAIKKSAAANGHKDYFWVKEVTGYTNSLYGYIDSLIKKGIIARTNEKNEQRGAKFKILK